MFLEFADWLFYADEDATRSYAQDAAIDRCTCGFCRNFYAALDRRYPDIRYFLSRFGHLVEAPDALVPITPTLYQASYLVQGRILRQGSEPVFVNDIPITAETAYEGESFLLDIGLMDLPWVLEEDPQSVPRPSGIPDLFAEFRK